MNAKRFIVIDAPYENGEPFLYKKMLDKTTKKEYDNSLKGIDDICDLANKLHEENEQLKKENYELHKRLGDFEPFEEHIQERTSKTSLKDIIGIVKTDEPTNSVELKKELYK